MQSDGRIEKRAPVKLSVHLVPFENRFVAETTLTVNISRRGARVVTGRRWRPGEQVVLTSTSGEFRRQATVVYCYPQTDGQFCMGLDFGANGRTAKDALWTDVA